MGKIFRLLGALILIGGLASAVWLYAHAPAAPADSIVIDNDTGLQDGLQPEDFKAYSHDMEAFGGKIWILFAKLQRALAALGQGRPLAVLVGVLSLVVGVTLLRASSPPASPRPNATDQEDPDIPGPPANGA